MSEVKKAFYYALPRSLPVLTGYLFLGITYGILMVKQGFPVWLPVLTAIVVYTGSMEFLLARILLTSFHPLSTFVTAVVVGARHLFYGISMLDKYRHLGWKKWYLIYTTSDETFAVNYSTPLPEKINAGWFYFWISFLDQMYWILGVALGAAFGAMMPFPTKGLDFSMTAMFLTIFMNQWVRDDELRGNFLKKHASAIIGLMASILMLLFFGKDRFIVPAMLLILLMLSFLRPSLEEKK